MSPTSPLRGDGASSADKGGPPFVGREQELALLERWFEDAAAGHPRVVLVQGEAGIGKTRLLHEAMAIARRLGMDVGLGRCYEDLALPYLAFHEILLPRLEQLPDDARASLGIDRETIGQLLHRAGTPSREARPVLAGQVDHEKLQLFLAVGHATVKFAQRRPMLLVVEDLHWADRMSLDLFDHVAFTAADTAAREPVPIVIIGTYRPLVPEERLGRLIARLQREEVCRSLSLDGLTEGEIHQLIGGLGVLSPSHQLTATVNDATHGNPLFIQEVMHHLQSQAALREQGGFVVTTAAASDLRLPDQVTGAIVARAEALSEPCRRAFTLAAFLGDGFTLQTLSAMSGVGEDELLDLLEEGMRQRLLRSDGPTFQFAHPLIRHVFYHQPSAPRRLRYHKQIADSLQAMHAESLDKHVLEIAHHLVKAGSVAAQDVVVSFARRAADQAFGVFAWSEAAYYYEAALTAAESTGNLDVRDRAALHFRAGLAHYYDQDIGPCLHHYQQAIDTYRQAGDVPGLGHALMEKARTQFTLASVPFGSVADLKPLENVILALGEQEPALRGHILAVIAEAYRNGRQAEKARERGQQALELGRQLRDDLLCAYASFVLALAHISDLHVADALEGWQNALVHARKAGDVIREGWALHRLPLALTLLGRLDEVEEVSKKACDSTRVSQDWSNHSLGLSHLASAAVARLPSGGRLGLCSGAPRGVERGGGCARCHAHAGPPLRGPGTRRADLRPGVPPVFAHARRLIRRATGAAGPRRDAGRGHGYVFRRAAMRPGRACRPGRRARRRRAALSRADPRRRARRALLQRLDVSGSPPARMCGRAEWSLDRGGGAIPDGGGGGHEAGGAAGAGADLPRLRSHEARPERSRGGEPARGRGLGDLRGARYAAPPAPRRAARADAGSAAARAGASPGGVSGRPRRARGGGAQPHGAGAQPPEDRGRSRSGPGDRGRPRGQHLLQDPRER